MHFCLRFLSAFVCLLLSVTVSFAQYGGYGGGYGGMGRSMGGMGGGQMGGSSKPPIPNIAGEMANKETKWLKENLPLDKEQAKAVKSLNNEYAKQQQEAIKEIINASGGKPGPQTNQQIRDAMMMYNEEKEDKLRAILTAEQWTMYQTKKPDMQREIGGIRPGSPKRDSTATITNGGRP